MVIRRAGPQCRMWVFGPPSSATVSRRIRTADALEVAASAAGTPTHVTYLPTFSGLGTFTGVQVDRVKPHVASVTLQESSTGKRLFAGRVSPGQIVVFEPTSVSWVGLSDPGYYGVDGAAVSVSPVWTVQERVAPLLFSGTPRPGQEIGLPGTGPLTIKLVPSGCSVTFALVVPNGGGVGGGGWDGATGPLNVHSWSGTWTCKEPRYPAMTLTIIGEGASSRLTADIPADPARDVYTITEVSPTGDRVSGTYVYTALSGRPPGAGRWSITFKGSEIELVRKDGGTPWMGTYRCVRVMTR